MNCTDIKGMFIDYIDNNLDNISRYEFEKHIKKCKVCSGELSQLALLNEKILKIRKLETPSSLFENFMFILENEKNKLNNRRFGLFNKSLLKIAASILIFITGSLFGVLLTRSYLVNTQVKDLENEIGKLKQIVAVTMFGQHTTSEKIKALYYSDESRQVGQKYLNALAYALQNDNNVNVRLAAAKALFRYKNIEEVNKLLIKSLSNQNEPMVQIILIKFLVDNKEKKAVESLKYLINNEKTNIVVRQYAEKGLQILL
jgi:ribosome biogenesis protein Nip4